MSHIKTSEEMFQGKSNEHPGVAWKVSSNHREDDSSHNISLVQRGKSPPRLFMMSGLDNKLHPDMNYMHRDISIWTLLKACTNNRFFFFSLMKEICREKNNNIFINVGENRNLVETHPEKI